MTSLKKVVCSCGDNCQGAQNVVICSYGRCFRCRLDLFINEISKQISGLKFFEKTYAFLEENYDVTIETLNEEGTIKKVCLIIRGYFKEKKLPVFDYDVINVTTVLFSFYENFDQEISKRLFFFKNGRPRILILSDVEENPDRVNKLFLVQKTFKTMFFFISKMELLKTYTLMQLKSLLQDYSKLFNIIDNHDKKDAISLKKECVEPLFVEVRQLIDEKSIIDENGILLDFEV